VCILLYHQQQRMFKGGSLSIPDHIVSLTNIWCATSCDTSKQHYIMCDYTANAKEVAVLQ